MLDCVVIGAGQAGLSASCHLSSLGIDHVVLERGRVAETWRTRWDSFFLNTPNWGTRLPGMDPPGEPDAFAPLADVIATFTAYAVRIAAPVQSGEVTLLRANERGFELTLADDALTTRSVVVATGAFQQATARPEPAADVPAGVAFTHTADYRNPGDLPDGGVLVVGSGQSGCEIGLELLEAGRNVHLSVGRCGWAPRRYRGREFLRWMVDIGAMDETIDVLPTPRARLAGNVAVSGSHGGRDCNPLVLEAAGAELHGRFVGFDGRSARFEDDLDASIEFGATFERDLCRRFDAYVTEAGLDLPEHPLRERARSTIASTELALGREGIGTVLFAGGYRPAFSWVEVPVFDELGFPRAQRGVTDVPGLAFVGLPWLHTRKSPLLLGVGADAAHVVDAIATHLAAV